MKNRQVMGSSSISLRVFICILAILSLTHPILAQELPDSSKLSREVIQSMTYDQLLDFSMEDLVKLARIAGLTVDELFDMIISTAGKKEEKVAEIPSSVRVITRDDIQKYGYRSLAEILENVPGLYAIDNLYMFGPSFGVRGFWNDQENSNIIFMVDGIRQTFEYFGSNPLTKIVVPVEAIDRIEIVKGPMSVMYGSGAFFGAINIITDHTSKESDAGSVSASYGSEKSSAIYAGLDHQHGDYTFGVNLSFRGTYGLSVPLKEMTSRDYTKKKLNLTSTNGTLEERDKYFNLHGGYKNLKAELIYTESYKEGYLFQPSGGKGSNSEMRTAAFALDWQKKLSHAVQVEGRFKYHRDWVNTDLDRYFGFYENDTVRYHTGVYEYDQYENNAIEAEFLAFIDPSPKLNLTAGFFYRGVTDLKYNNDHPAYRLPIYYNSRWYLDDSRIENMAPYLQLQYSPVENIKLVAGARLEYASDYAFTIRSAFDTTLNSSTYYTYTYKTYTYTPVKMEFIPRLAVIYSMNDNNVVKLLYGKALKNPSFESVTDSRTRGFAIKPEYINTLELNFTSHPVKPISLDASFFMNYLNDLIIRKYVYDTTEKAMYSVLANGENLRSSGIEMQVSIVPLRNLNIQLGGSWQQTRHQDADSLPVPYSPGKLGYFKVDYTPFSNVSASLTCQFVDRMKTGYDPYIGTSDTTMGAFIGRTSPAYANLSGNILINNLLTSNFYLNLHVTNILNQKQFYPTTNFNPWADKGTLRHNRFFMLTVGFRFR
jgi:outer membrane receptor protein involved in Fe transport